VIACICAGKGEASSRGHDLLQDLQALGVELGVEHADPGGVAAGFGQAANQPGGEQVAERDDRYCARRPLRRADCRNAEGEDDARLHLDERLGELGQPFGMALGVPELEADVAAIDQPERRQCVLEPGRGRLDIVRRVDAQDADNRQIVGFLRQCRDGDA
jgi:hypothetical protein